MKEPVTTQVFEKSFPTSGMDAEQVMHMVTAMMCALRKKAAEAAAERLADYGWFNGELIQSVHHEDGHVRCEVVINDYGPPLRLDDDTDAALQEKRELLDSAGEEISRLQMELIESEQVADQLRAEIAAVADRADELAEVWGDEANFRRLRERLRELADNSPAQP